MQLLEAGRGHGRNDYPLRPMWNSQIAGFVLQHPRIAALRRELLRNGQLRDRCGFHPFEGAAAVPSEYAYSRFRRRLRKYQRQLEERSGRLFAQRHQTHDSAIPQTEVPYTRTQSFGILLLIYMTDSLRTRLNRSCPRPFCSREKLIWTPQKHTETLQAASGF